MIQHIARALISTCWLLTLTSTSHAQVENCKPLVFNDAGIATIDDAVVGFNTVCYGFKMPKGKWMSVDVGPETGVDFEIDFTDALNNDRSLDFSTTHKVFTPIRHQLPNPIRRQASRCGDELTVSRNGQKFSPTRGKNFNLPLIWLMLSSRDVGNFVAGHRVDTAVLHLPSGLDSSLLVILDPLFEGQGALGQTPR